MSGLSVVVATHADTRGLYLTVFSLIQQLQRTSLDWEIIVAADGGSSTKWEKLRNVSCLRINTGSPQGTRDAGIRAANFSKVLCVESHVVVSDIEAWYKQASSKIAAALTFPARIGETDELFSVYNTETNWVGDLWIKKHLYNRLTEPSRVVQFGHAAFMVDRKWYLEYGGYTLEQKGWGGEEPYLCLKAWMTGYSCWVLPDIWIAHHLLPGAHTNYRQSENFINNIAIVRYVMTGDPSTLKITSALREERNRIVSGPFEGNIEKLKAYLKKEGIIQK